MGGPKKKRMKLDSQSAGKSSRTRRTGLSNGTGVGSESSWPERSLQDLPDNVLTSVFRHLGLDRLLAIQVCRRWRSLGQDPLFTRVVKGNELNAALQAAGPGDTIVLPPGFYQEILLIEKPLKIIGQHGQDIHGRDRKGVVLQSNRATCALCNARVCFQNIVFRSILPSGDRSIVGFGPACKYVRLQDCELGGITGLLVPASKDIATQLVLLGCYLHGVPHNAAITMEGGRLRMEGCTITNCQVALNVLDGIEVIVRNSEVSFNEVALVFDGHGTIENNVFWGNLHRSTIDVSAEALQRIQVQQAPDAGGQGSAAGAGAQEAAAVNGVSGQQQAPVSPATGRRFRSAAPRPPVIFSGNHIVRPLRLRNTDAEQDRIRRKVRKLAAEVYGAHEPGGEFEEHEGGWHFVNDGDFADSDDSADDDMSQHSSDDSLMSDGLEGYSSLSDESGSNDDYDDDDHSVGTSEFATSEDDSGSSSQEDSSGGSDEDGEGLEEDVQPQYQELEGLAE